MGCAKANLTKIKKSFLNCWKEKYWPEKWISILNCGTNFHYWSQYENPKHSDEFADDTELGNINTDTKKTPLDVPENSTGMGKTKWYEVKDYTLWNF